MEKTFWQLLIDGLVDAKVCDDQETAIRELEVAMDAGLIEMLQQVGYSVPAYSGGVRFYLIAQDVEEDIT